MGYEEYNSTIHEWFDIIELNRARNPEVALPYCKKMEEYADSTNDEKLKGYTLFNTGYCEYVFNDIQSAYKYITRALDLLIRTEQWALVARSYNILGIIANNQGNMPLALDYYFKGLSFCDFYDLPQSRYYININVGALYMGINDMPNAIESFRSGVELINRNFDFTHAEKVTTYVNLTACYIKTGRLEEAEQYFQLAADENIYEKNIMNDIILFCLEAEICNFKGDVDKRDAIIDKLTELKASKVALLDGFDDLYYYAKMLLNIEKYDALWNFINEIGRLVDKSKSIYIQRRMVSLKLQYYKKIKDTNNYQKESVFYFELSELLEREQAEILKNSLNLRVSLEEAQRKRREVEERNTILKQKSEKDALTDMYNRYKLNEVSEAAFQKAYIQGAYLGIEILDIDYFKQYNDNYGHQAGDLVLVKVADCIRSLEENIGVSTARYGGDEFVIIYEGFREKEVRKIVRELQRKISELNIPHEYSPISNRISVSQGVFFKIPKANNKLWDFLYAADLALYQVKDAGRNGYHISLKAEEKKEVTVEEN
ncbi:MAG: tetratricopeptide repeat-containing diguanylate cyclase [Lachnospiraceae bacterium]